MVTEEGVASKWPPCLCLLWHLWLVDLGVGFLPLHFICLVQLALANRRRSHCGGPGKSRHWLQMQRHVPGQPAKSGHSTATECRRPGSCHCNSASHVVGQGTSHYHAYITSDDKHHHLPERPCFLMQIFSSPLPASVLSGNNQSSALAGLLHTALSASALAAHVLAQPSIAASFSTQR